MQVPVFYLQLGSGTSLLYLAVELWTTTARVVGLISGSLPLPLWPLGWWFLYTEPPQGIGVRSLVPDIPFILIGGTLLYVKFYSINN